MKKRNQKILEKTKKFIEKSNISKQEKTKQYDNLKKILEQPSKQEIYNLLYDELCDYLDNEFKKHNYCAFKDGICEKRRCTLKEGQTLYPNGCCFSTMKQKNCKYLTKTGCSIKNIGCKLYTCSYIKKKKNARFSLNKIYLSKYTLNIRQKLYICSTFFIPKEELLKEIIKRGGIYGIK